MKTGTRSRDLLNEQESNDALPANRVGDLGKNIVAT